MKVDFDISKYRNDYCQIGSLAIFHKYATKHEIHKGIMTWLNIAK